MDLILVGMVLPWLFVALGGWLGYQLLRQNGRLLLRLEALEQRLPQHGTAAAPTPAPQGLPVGSAAPPFALPDLSGARRGLSDFRGRRLLLIFFNPRCGFCTRMAPDLAALPIDAADGRPLPLVVSTGDPEENRKLAAEHGIRCPVLLQEAMEVAARYQAHGTPMGYRIDENGRIAGELAVGADALLALAEKGTAAVSASGPQEHKGNRSLADSKLNRNGLPAGTPAPGFVLPALEGGKLSLEQFRGRRVLLVFSDPQCGPCTQLMAHLEQFHRRSGEVQVLMVSRGDAEANRAKAAKHGLTFPILLQKQWEISREYAMFATPIAYLIDEQGVLVAEAAVGLEPILTLLAGAAATREKAAERRCGCGKLGGECRCGRKKRRAAAVAAGLLIGLLAAGTAIRPAAAQGYAIEDLGTLGGNISVATSLNAAGQVVGFSSTPAGPLHAFCWSQGHMLDLGTLGGSESRATAINDAGQVVGVSSLPGDRTRRAFLWSEERMQPLPTLGGAESYAAAINAAGHVLGWANTTGGAFHAFCYRQGEMGDLGALGGDAGMALGIDEAGEVLVLVSDGWGTQACLQTEGGRIDLGTLGGSYTVATAINAAGQVVGGSDTVANAAQHAFRWSRGGMADLGALGHRDSLAYGLNAAGVVVGASYTDSDPIRHAFVYREGQGMLDLNRLIEPGQGWQLVEAQGINGAGQIVGWGYHNGQLRAFRLLPAVGVPSR